jgi:hypothetical protein
VYKKTHSALQIGRRERGIESDREREKQKEEEKERKIKEIGNCLPHTRYAPSTPRPPNSLPKKNKKTRGKKNSPLRGPRKQCAQI